MEAQPGGLAESAELAQSHTSSHKSDVIPSREETMDQKYLPNAKTMQNPQPCPYSGAQSTPEWVERCLTGSADPRSLVVGKQGDCVSRSAEAIVGNSQLRVHAKITELINQTSQYSEAEEGGGLV